VSATQRPFIVGNSLWVTTVGFMQLFQDLEVRNYQERYDPNFDRRLKVDVSLDMKERIQYKLLAGGHKELEQADTRLPRISIQMVNIQPDLQRYNGKGFKRTLKRQQDGLVYDIQPFPINIEYSVSIWAKYFEHYAQLLENIIPWFDPYVTVGVKERNFGIERELRVKLDSVGQSSTFELEGGAARIIRGDMTFTVETFAYKTQTDITEGIIYEVNVPIVDIVTPLSSETISISGSPEDMII
jgi:hypothetical protein